MTRTVIALVENNALYNQCWLSANHFHSATRYTYSGTDIECHLITSS